MFGMGMGELIIVAIVALLALGPDRLPGAAKKIGKTIRELRKQTSNLKKTIEEDTQLGDAMKEIKQAFRDDVLRETPKRPKPKPKKKAEGEGDEKAEGEGDEKAEGEPESESESESETETAAETESDSEREGEDVVADANEVADADVDADPEMPKNNTVFVEPANGETVATEPRNINMSEFQKYVHMWGPQAAADKYGTSLQEAEAAIDAVVSQAKRDSDA